jgi:hypothetical protein
MAPTKVASQILWQYLGVLDRIFGMYIDACVGLEDYGAKFEQATLPTQRQNKVFIGDGDPNRKEATYQHVTTIDDLISRNKRDGDNSKLLSQSCLVLIYSIWDTVVRPEYCKALKVKQEAVRSDLMGDLRFYRNAIIHTNALLGKETKILSFVKAGDPVVLTRVQTTELFVLLFDEMNKINVEHVGEAFDLRFERRLNA